MPYRKLVITPSQYTKQEVKATVQVYKGFSTVASTKDSRLYDFDLIKQDLLNQFNTRKGERVMNPEFGTVIWDLIFDPFTDDTKELIKSDVNKILNSDPRIVPIQINVYEEQYGMMLESTLQYVGSNQTENIRLSFDRETGLGFSKS
jgi:phage baseplate assembly protein W